MSVLVVGLSHRSAPVPVLERAAVSGDALGKLLRDVFHAEHVAGTFTVSTCNRVEVYAEVDKFHAGVSVICEMLARHSGVALPELTPHLYVHYEDRAVQHLLSMTCGLESMVVGESQILGQVRRALALARKHQTIGRTLDDLGTLALRTAKRAHTQTGIDRAGANLVTVGAGLAAARLAAPVTTEGAAPVTTEGAAPVTTEGAAPVTTEGAAPVTTEGAAPVTTEGAAPVTTEGAAPVTTPLAVSAAAPPGPSTAAPLHGRTVLVVGAGSMSALAVATAARLGAARMVVANRTRERAERLAASVGGTTADLHDLRPALAAADLVISCTGAAGLVITADMVTAALGERQPAGGARPLVLLDLALPRDVDPKAGRLPGVTVIGLESLQDVGASLAASQAGDVAAVRAIVAEELAARASARHAARVAPTVVALRAKAVEVVEAELARLAGKLGEIDDRARAEIAQAMHRVMDKLLHAPTVRVKELAGSPGGDSYEAALRVLFDLDPEAVEAVTRADAGLVAGGPPPAVPPEQEAR